MPVVWIAVAGLVVALALWWVWRGTDTVPPVSSGDLDTILRQTAERHGVATDNLEIDREIRKLDGVFVRNWSLSPSWPSSEIAATWRSASRWRWSGGSSGSVSGTGSRPSISSWLFESIGAR
jgi:hypothetical protein